MYVMKKFLLKLPILLLTPMLVLTTACDDDDDSNTTPSTPKTIAATVADDSRFTILEEALDRAGLINVLADANANFTVFAPNDAAFQDLLTNAGYADLDALENALTTAGLRNVLLYHVLGAKVTSDMVTTGYATTQATNADGDMLSLYTSTASGVSLNGGVMVKSADIMASNGVIHEIEGVITPLNIVQLIALNTSTYSSLTTALGVADGNLVDVLSDTSATYTVFAPDDAAFSALLQATNSADLNELVTNLGGTDDLANVLLYHVTPGNVRAEDLSSGQVPTAFPMNSIIVNVGAEVTITDGQMGTSTVKETNIQGTNGVVHRISAVLVP